MKLVKVNSENITDVNKFINFPFTIYQDHPYWVPALKHDMLRIFDKKKHPFYDHSNADFFIVESENEVLGRIAVLQNKNFNNHHHSNTAFFYYFDSIDDNQVINMLFESTADWAHRENLSSLTGPKGFMRSNGVGLLADGFDYMPAMGITYNYPYYVSQLERFGFNKETDFLSGYMDYSHHVPEKIHEAAEKVKKRSNFWIKEFANSADIHKWIHLVEEVHTKAFASNPNFIPSTSKEFRLIAETMVQISKPGLIKLIMKENQVAGFIIAYPNINRAIQQIKGQLLPLGWLKILLEKNKTTLCDLNGLGLLPEYQGAGANLLLYNELEKTLRQNQFDRVELVQVDERNYKSKSDMENMGVNWYKKHRVFQIDI